MGNLPVNGPAKLLPSAADKQARQRASKALSNARQRCNNPKNPDYSSYGAMGVEVRFKSVDHLIAAIGLPLKALSLDRINPNGHYEPGNVRWASAAVQAANKKLSAVNLHLSDMAIIDAQKEAIAAQNRRKATTVCWVKATRAYNQGYVTDADAEFLANHLNCPGVLEAGFDLNTVADMANHTPGYIHLPALTLPDARVRLRAQTVNLPENAERLKRSGRMAILEGLDHEWNVPEVVWQNAVEACQNGSGLLLIQKSTPATLLAGGIEGTCLALASSLFGEANYSTAFFPMLKLLKELDDIGSQWGWDDVAHPALDAQVVIVPDFVLDCGDWGHLSNRLWKASALLEYRQQHGRTTIIGAPSVASLPPAAKQLVAGAFRCLKMPSRSAHPKAPLKFSAEKLPLGSDAYSFSDLKNDPDFYDLFDDKIQDNLLFT